MPAILLSTFPKFITSSCGKEPARLELPARLVPGLPKGESEEDVHVDHRWVQETEEDLGKSNLSR